MARTTQPISKRLEKALRSENLATALSRALPMFREKRRQALAGKDFPTLQREIYELKRDAIDRLPKLVEQFTQAAQAVGAKVYRAETAEDAQRIVAGLVQERGAKLVVKSKSNLTEEVDLNAALEAVGAEVVETDLGEWIAQLAHDHPSHILAPIVHMTREEIAALFSKETGTQIAPETSELVKVARQELRQRFIDADVGITGANAAIAETGGFMVISNEGNARLVSTLPPVHIAMIGIEKIVPTMQDTVKILELLPPSATGQRVTSYISYITGPSRTADIELALEIGVQGPKELHIVLVDNGRMAMRADPAFREALHCLKCGACANVCPPFQVVGGHVFGHVYTGPIGLVLTPFHHGIEHIAAEQALCASCNACETVCPAGIPIPRQILDVRTKVVEQKGLPAKKRIPLETFADPGRFGALAGLGRLAQKPFVRDGVLRNVPLTGSLTNWRSMPALADPPFHETAADAVSRIPAKTIAGSAAVGLTVAYFAGCITDLFFPRMAESVVAVLAACGCRVTFPEKQWCCGLPASNSGDRPLAMRMARQTIEALEDVDADCILSGQASCVVTMLDDYPHHFKDEPEWLERIERLRARVIDFTGFMYRVARLPEGALAADAPYPLVTYHDACQTHNCLGLREEPRHLIRSVLGLEMAELPESNACCGFGGSFSLEYPEVSKRVLGAKLQNVDATGAAVLVTDNTGCIMHLRGGMDATGRPVRVLHLAELMAERLAALPA